MKSKVHIDTKYGKGFIDEMWVSELGYLMIRVDVGGRWISFNLGKHDTEKNIFTNLISDD